MKNRTDAGAALAEGFSQTRAVPPPGNANRVCEGWLAQAERETRATWSESGCKLEVGGIGAFHITRQGDSHRLRVDRDADPLEVDEVESGGPVRVLSLALKGVFCLHASAAARNGGAVLFAGESGQGKSTLAAYLRGAGWPRLADDILPIRMASDKKPQAVAGFPQFKLSQTEQQETAAFAPIPLIALCELDTSSEPGAIPAQRRLSAAQTMKMILRHTVASRLFDGDLTRRHFAFASAVAASASGLSLRYARERAALPGARMLLDEIMAQLSQAG